LKSSSSSSTPKRAGLGFLLNIQPRNEQDLGFITEAAGTSPKISAVFFFNARKLVKIFGSLLAPSKICCPTRREAQWCAT
jgi:hypothetical protein